MIVRPVTKLPARIVALQPVCGSSTVLACAGRAGTFAIDVLSGRVDTIVPPYASDAIGVGVGGGGWNDCLFAVSSSGAIHVRRGLRPVVTKPFGPLVPSVGECAAARDARRVVCAVPYAESIVRSEVIVVYDIELSDDEDSARLTQVCRFDPPSHDCFNIDLVALSPDGRWAGLSGHEVIYDSSYSPSSWVREIVCLVDTAKDNRGIVLEVAESSWRTDVVTRPIAFSSDNGSCFVDGYIVPVSALEAAAAAESLVYQSLEDAEYEFAPPPPTHYQPRLSGMENTILAALDGGGFAAVGQPSLFRRDSSMKPTRLVVGHPSEPAETDAIIDLDHILNSPEFTGPAQITAMTAVEGSIVLGLSNGQIALAERR